MTAKEMVKMLDPNSRYVVISADGHVGPKIEAYRAYCPKKYLTVFDEQIERVRAARRDDTGMLDMGEVLMKAIGHPVHGRLLEAYNRVGQLEGAWDPAARLRDMDGEGIAAEVIFHGHQNGEPMPLTGDGFLHPKQQLSRHEYDVPGCRMYNRWLADFVSYSNGRQAGLAYIPIMDVSDAIKEVEWAREAGCEASTFPRPVRICLASTTGHLTRCLTSAPQLDMPLTTHAGGGERWDYGAGNLTRLMDSVERSFAFRRGAWQLIFSGVFERFPNLKFVLTELRSFWIPEMLRDMDGTYLNPQNPDLKELIPRLPSEYWASNCYVGASFMAPRKP